MRVGTLIIPFFTHEEMEAFAQGHQLVCGRGRI